MTLGFTEEERLEIENRLYTCGYKLLLEGGIKNLRIEDLAKKAGISIGSFYNFFPNKNAFIIKLIYWAKASMEEEFTLLFENYPQGVPCEVLSDFFLDYISEDNIYRVFTQEGYNKIFPEVPGDSESLAKTGQFIMSKLATDKGLEEFLLFTQCIRILVIGTSDLSKLDKNLLRKALSPLVKAACQLLY